MPSAAIRYDTEASKEELYLSNTLLASSKSWSLLDTNAGAIHGDPASVLTAPSMCVNVEFTYTERVDNEALLSSMMSSRARLPR